MSDTFTASIFFPLIKEKIDKVEESRLIFKNFSKRSFFNEFRTIRINLGRRSGHTTLALKILNDYENSIVFVHNSVMINYFPDFYKKEDRVFCYKQINKGYDFYNKIIICDVFSLFPNSFIDGIYGYDPVFLILLG